jgi:hypothetical protein
MVNKALRLDKQCVKYPQSRTRPLNFKNDRLSICLCLFVKNTLRNGAQSRSRSPFTRRSRLRHGSMYCTSTSWPFKNTSSTTTSRPPCLPTRSKKQGSTRCPSKEVSQIRDSDSIIISLTFYLLTCFSNIYSTVRDIIRTSGPIGLWRGTFPTILR